MKKVFIIFMVSMAALMTLSGCSTEADKVSYNISKEADNFNVVRRLVVINARSDKPVFEITGTFSFTLDGNRIIVVAEVGPNQFKKHSVGLNEWTLWSIEDISGANVNKYKYEVNFLPESIIPIEITNSH